MDKPFEMKPLTQGDYAVAHRYPATTSRGKFYLLQGDTVIGRMRMASARTLSDSDVYDFVNVEPDDDATREFFKDDFTIPGFGMVVGLRYDGLFGRPLQNFNNEPEDRHKGTEIVDEIDFDFGIAHPRYATVKGWSSIGNARKPSIKSKQLKRRSRSSNKIKKVA